MFNLDSVVYIYVTSQQHRVQIFSMQHQPQHYRPAIYVLSILSLCAILILTLLLFQQDLQNQSSDLTNAKNTTKNEILSLANQLESTLLMLDHLPYKNVLSSPDNALYKQFPFIEAIINIDQNKSQLIIHTNPLASLSYKENLIYHIRQLLMPMKIKAPILLLTKHSPNTLLLYIKPIAKSNHTQYVVFSLNPDNLLPKINSNSSAALLYISKNQMNLLKKTDSNMSDQEIESISTMYKTSSFFQQEHYPYILSATRINDLPLLVLSKVALEPFYKNTYSNRMTYLLVLLIISILAGLVAWNMFLMKKQISHIQDSELAAIYTSRAKSDFLAKMSHELRTPLNAIIGFSEMLASGFFGHLNPTQTDRIKDIYHCGSHLLELITDILEFSQGEGGKIELKEEWTNLNELIEKILRIVSQRATASEIMISTHIPPIVPRLFIDEKKTRQILLNLLSNALKFTPKKGDISLTITLPPTGECTIVVKDNGIGIAATDIPKALSVFGQVHTHLSNEGVGLGLPLCKLFVELHGGYLNLESRIDEGTIVSITFPHSRVEKLSNNITMAAS